MSRHRTRGVSLALAGSLAFLTAASALAVRRTEDPLALVPADAATVAVIRWSELRTSPLADKVFADMDRISGDGDAQRFLRETGLTPREDIDTVIVAMSPTRGTAKGHPESGLVLFEGRFDLNRIASALTSRGAKLEENAAGAFYRLADVSTHDEQGAVALVNRGLIICGSESAVVAALGRRETGGEGGLTSGEGLGKNLSRVDQDSSAWALVDLTRFPSRVRSGDGGPGEPSQALVGAMKSVSLIAVQARVKGDDVDFAATGVSASEENRELLEDALRGVLAMWRMAVQDKAPQLVSVIRRFKIENSGDGVSIRGTLPGQFLRDLSATRRASRER